MATPVETLERTVRLNRERLRNLQPAHVKRVLELSRAAQRELEKRLRSLDPTRFSAQRVRSLQLQINDVIQELGREVGSQFGGAVEAIGTEAAPIAMDDLRAQFGAWAAEHPGAARAVIRVEQAGATLSPGLLEHFGVSRLRYGDDAILSMRDAMAQSLLADETMIQASARLADSLGLKDWEAERIVRTEQSNTFHVQWMDEARTAVEGEEDEWRKELVATFDLRTGEDSKFVNGQQRRLDEEFEDNLGHKYQQPPNRPNDRETVILVLAETD